MKEEEEETRVSRVTEKGANEQERWDGKGEREEERM